MPVNITVAFHQPPGYVVWSPLCYLRPFHFTYMYLYKTLPFKFLQCSEFMQTEYTCVQ